MATKLYYAINPLASSDKASTGYAFMVDDLSHCRSREPEQSNKNNPGDSMDRKLERQKIESIGKTMEMHEAIFKHQVSELHRLYKVQRMLMDEAKKQTQPHETQNGRTPNQMAIPSGFYLGDPKSEQPTRSCTGETRKIGIGFDLERPAEEDIVSAAANRSSSNNTNQMNTADGSGEEDSDVELTLGIGGSSGKHKRHRNSNIRIQNHTLEINSWGNSSKSEQREDCRSSPTTPMSSSSATFEHHLPQEAIKRPHWLFQR